MKVFRRVALVALTEKGIEKARQLRGRLRKGDLYRPEPFGPCQHAWEKAIGLPLSQHLPEWFQTYDQIVFFLAVGAVVRLIAPLLESKKHDPGVLAIDEQAHFVVPVLSGHEGGANTFARVVAGTLGATAVVTTATDATETAVLDEIAEDLDGIVEPSESWKQAAMALVQNHNAIIVQEIGRRGVWVEEHTWPSNTICLHSFDNMPDRSNQFVIGISDHLHGDKPVDLWIRPGSLVVGVGCERGISSEALDDGLTRFLSESGFCRRSVRRLATVDVKQDEQGLIAFAASNHWQLDFYTPTELSQVGEVPNPSLVVEKLMGCAGVAEPAALLAAGTSQLLVPKRVVASPLAKQRMTFALARLADFQEAGPATGRVVFVGAGPGDPGYLTVKAANLLRRADVVLYAGSLIPETILRRTNPRAELHNSAYLTLEETDSIVQQGVAQGKLVVRLHSGDTSIYSAIAEQIERLDKAKIRYEVIPGISAFQAAAAFLKTEWTLPGRVQTVILTRAEGRTKMPSREALEKLAVHQATLCLFLSAKLGDTVQEKLLSAYPPETPVALFYRVTWPDQQVVLTELRSLSKTLKECGFTRTTLIVVGEAVAGIGGRSKLYDPRHGHLFRPRTGERGNRPGD